MPRLKLLRLPRHLLVVCLCVVFLTLSAEGQAVTVSGSSSAVHSGFSERFGVGFGFNHRGFSLRSGRGRGFSPGRFGGGFPGTSVFIPFGGGRGGFSFFAGQSYRQSYSSFSQALTITPGVPAGVFSGTVDPFVTQLTPVVGNGFSPQPGSTVRGMLGRGDIKVEEDEFGKKRFVIQAQSSKKPSPRVPPKKRANPFLESLKQYSEDK